MSEPVTPYTNPTENLPAPTQAMDIQLQPGSKIEFTAEQVELIKNTVAVGATNDELKMFLHVAQQRGLDPFGRQIFFIKRGQGRDAKVSIQTSIDGFRLVAERTGKYKGQKGPYWCGKDGKWVDVWLDSAPPMAASVAILRSDFQEPIRAVALYTEFCQQYNGKASGLWAKMPALMLAKCAEALAFRKAFPQDLSGIYTSDEMAQAEPDQGNQKPHQEQRQAPRNDRTERVIPQTGEVVESEPMARPDQIKEIRSIHHEMGTEPAEEVIKKLTVAKATEYIRRGKLALEKKRDEEAAMALAAQSQAGNDAPEQFDMGTDTIPF